MSNPVRISLFLNWFPSLERDFLDWRRGEGKGGGNGQ